jgi:hypothetical protein
MNNYVNVIDQSNDVFIKSHGDGDTANTFLIYEQHNQIPSQEPHINQTCIIDPIKINDDWTNMIDHKSVSITDDWIDIIDIIDKKESNNNVLIQSSNTFVCKVEVSKKKEEKKKIEHVDIEDIMVIDIKNMKDLILLEKTSLISKNLKFQFNQKIDEDKSKFVKWMILSLKWLQDVMYDLSARTFQLRKKDSETQNPLPNSIELSLNLKKSTDPNVTNMSDKKSQNISRNSYKFCDFGHMCRFNYDKDQKCCAQHYVYNLVYLDIVDILEYIAGIDNICDHPQNISEIKTSVNTITYVINHMYEELNQLKNVSPHWYADYENRLYKFRLAIGFKHQTNKTYQSSSKIISSQNSHRTKKMSSKTNKTYGRDNLRE